MNNRFSRAIIRRLRRFAEWLVRPYIAKAVDAAFYSFEQARQLRATFDSLDYAEAHMQNALVCSEKPDVLDHALKHVSIDGLFLEFGVWKGVTVNFIAERHDGVVHGFDSFEGLPEDWAMHYSKGYFATDGRLPDVRPNVKLHVGWFDQTLPSFVDIYDGAIAFLHVDCDLYSSTKAIFDHLGDRITAGTVIVFDEYFNYDGWRQHEYLAFQEFIAESGHTYRYLAYDQFERNVATLIV